MSLSLTGRIYQSRDVRRGPSAVLSSEQGPLPITKDGARWPGEDGSHAAMNTPGHRRFMCATSLGIEPHTLGVQPQTPNYQAWPLGRGAPPGRVIRSKETGV